MNRKCLSIFLSTGEWPATLYVAARKDLMDVIDFLTCGGCQTEFPLSMITIFIEHKKSDCRVASIAGVPSISTGKSAGSEIRCNELI